jgi:hypothetical protein
MVRLTLAPSRNAPRNSNTDAIMIAWTRRKLLDPTEVPNALATSLAPRPYAAPKAKMPPAITIQ